MAKQNNQNQTSILLSGDKMLPQAVDIEDAVLGALINERESISRIDLNPWDFYKIANERIFLSIKNLYDRGNPIDMFTVVNELNNIGELENIGGAYRITVLSSGVQSGANLEYHASILKQKSIARRLIQMSNYACDMAYSPSTDIGDVVEFIEKQFTEITTDGTSCEDSSMLESLSDTIDYIKKIQEDLKSGKNPAITTGLKELDKLFNGGFKAPDLIILGGRPSMGKTQFAVHFAKHASQTGNDTLFISIEMTKIQLILRMITEHDGIDFYRIKTGQLTNEEWQIIDYMITQLSSIKLSIADTPQIRYLHNIKSLARKKARAGLLKMMIIDYIGLIRTNMKFGTRDLEIGYITGELKSLAKELNIPIILLAQVGRPPKGTRVEKPKLDDLRESGNIEQDADIVLFPHRPCYYDLAAVDESGQSWEQRGFIYVPKNREGEINKSIIFEHDKQFKKIWIKGEVNQHFTNDFIEPNRNFYEPQKDDNPF